MRTDTHDVARWRWCVSLPMVCLLQGILGTGDRWRHLLSSEMLSGPHTVVLCHSTSVVSLSVSLSVSLYHSSSVSLSLSMSVSPPVGCCHLQRQLPFIIIIHPKDWYSFYHTMQVRRLSCPRWVATFQSGLPSHRWSPIPVLTKPDVEQVDRDQRAATMPGQHHTTVTELVFSH